MHYLIDGHNLIAHMPDISLDDPNDEAKLVLRLRGWTAAGSKRKATVVFDGGLPGGADRRLSTSQVQVVFASSGQQADPILIARIRQARNPAEFTLVSSDREVLAAAGARKMARLSSAAFARKLAEGESTSQRSGPAAEPTLTDDQVAEWLEIFERPGEE